MLYDDDDVSVVVMGVISPRTGMQTTNDGCIWLRGRLLACPEENSTLQLSSKN